MLLEIKSLTKTYGLSRGISDINLEIGEGRVVGLLGPNGSGKTTIIKLINGLLSPSYGEIKVCGLPVGVESKKLVSYLPERTYLDMSMSVKECLDFFSDFYGDFNRSKAESMLEKLKVPIKAKLKTLSKGTKEKVQLVLVMSREARLYILDEPIAGVDPGARDFVMKLALENLRPNSTLVICTHLVKDIEPVLDDIVFLNEGRVMLHKSKQEIIEEYGNVENIFRRIYSCF